MTYGINLKMRHYDLYPDNEIFEKLTKISINKTLSTSEIILSQMDILLKTKTIFSVKKLLPNIDEILKDLCEIINFSFPDEDDPAIVASKDRAQILSSEISTTRKQLKV